MGIESCLIGVRKVYGETAWQVFCKSRVAIIGLGGVGSWIAEALVRSGIGSLVIMDMDEVSITNVNRQLHTLYSTVGRMKVDVMGERLVDIAPWIKLTILRTPYDADHDKELWAAQPDVVVDAIDSIEAKAYLVASSVRRQIPIVVSGGAGGRRDPTRVRVDDLARTEGDPLLAKLRRLLKTQYDMPIDRCRPWGVPCVFSTERPVYPAPGGGISYQRHAELSDSRFGAVAPVTGAFGLMAAGVVLNNLAAKVDGS